MEMKEITPSDEEKNMTVEDINSLRELLHPNETRAIKKKFRID